jgi:glycosyltransferase involved in cell wall biosynthesis
MKNLRLEDGGVVRAVLDICGGLAAAGIEVVLVNCDHTDAPQSWKDHEPRTPRLENVDPPSKRSSRLPHSSLKRIQQLVEQTDIVHLHAVWQPSNLQIAQIANRSDKPYIASIHGMLDDWCISQRALKKKLFLALGGRRYLEGAARAHFTADGERAQSMKWLPRGQAEVIPLMFDLAQFNVLPGPEPFDTAFPGARAPGLPTVLFLSRLHYKKGVGVLIDAVGMLRDLGQPVRCLIAGAGDDRYEAELREQVNRLGLGDSVRFLGLVVGEAKVSLFETADVFVLPTSQENFGFVLPEALACKTPVITTKGVDIWPELEASGGAIIVEQDARAIASAMTSVLNDPETAAKMGGAGRRWVFDTLDSGKVVSRFIELYQMVSSEHGSS